MVKTRTVVLYPHLGPKAGTGHIKRLLPFFYDSRFDVYIIHRDPEFVKDVASKFNIDSDRVFALSEILSIPNGIDIIILDNRESDRYLYDKLKNIAPIVAIDEGGDARDYIPYCIDILPNFLESEANYFNPGLLDLPIKEKRNRVLENILVTFGGQDPYNLTQKIVDEYKDKYNVTTVIGPLFKKKEFGVNKLENPDNFKELIYDYDLVITSFGITAYESIASGVPVALLNPTTYHKELSNKAGFYSLDDKLFINYKKATKVLNKIDIGTPENLIDFIYDLEVSNSGCPLCGRKNNSIIRRFKDKSYYNCFHCSMDYMLSHKKDTVYADDYFFTDYKKQYGKTYLEDFEHIQDVGNSRIRWILKKIKKGDSLLDIGCAYGPFLKASEKNGLQAFGIDISYQAIEYIKNHLSLPAVRSPFPLSKPLGFKTPFNAITMWYVIEHFKNLDDVLSQVNSLLSDGGVFAFSTPNASGISGRKEYKKFLYNSPSDHFTLWSPVSAKKVLKEYGFKVYKINITGHHPERFGRIVKGRFMMNIFMLISRIFRLGDTFEVYSIKENSI